MPNDIILGIIKFIYKYIPCPLCNDIFLVVSININGRIHKIININEIIANGKKIERPRVEKFLEQFKDVDYNTNIFNNEIIKNIKEAEKICYYIKTGISEFQYEVQRYELFSLYKVKILNYRF